MIRATRARYTLEFRQEAVRLVESGQRIASALAHRAWLSRHGHDSTQSACVADPRAVPGAGRTCGSLPRAPGEIARRRYLSAEAILVHICAGMRPIAELTAGRVSGANCILVASLLASNECSGSCSSTGFAPAASDAARNECRIYLS